MKIRAIYRGDRIVGWVNAISGDPCDPPTKTPSTRGRLRVRPKYPLLSDAAGVHPCQRQDAYEESVDLGVPTEFDGLGRAIFNSREHRRKYCRAKNYHDRDGSYGDA